MKIILISLCLIAFISCNSKEGIKDKPFDIRIAEKSFLDVITHNKTRLSDNLEIKDSNIDYLDSTNIKEIRMKVNHICSVDKEEKWDIKKYICERVYFDNNTYETFKFDLNTVLFVAKDRIMFPAEDEKNIYRTIKTMFNSIENYREAELVEKIYTVAYVLRGKFEGVLISKDFIRKEEPYQVDYQIQYLTKEGTVTSDFILTIHKNCETTLEEVQNK